MRLRKILLFCWLFALAQGAQAVAAPRENAFQYDEVVSAASFEFWDQDAQLLYLRARWYDPRIGRFISADPFEGKQREPRSLNRYTYVHSDPVHNIDPNGEVTISELNQTMSQIGRTASSIGSKFAHSVKSGWAAIREAGSFAERRVQAIVEQCLKPKSFQKKLTIPGSKKKLDGIADLAGELFKWETKSTLPKKGSAALYRLRDQILAYQKSGSTEKYHLVIGDKFTKQEMASLLKYFKSQGIDTGGVKIFSGLVHFAAWLGEAYGVLCLEK